MRNYYLYIIECVNGSYYTGYTTDIRRRYQEHQSGSAKCKYTRSFPPLQLAAVWRVVGTHSGILQLESKIKQYSKIKKIELVQQPDQLNTITNLKVYHECSESGLNIDRSCSLQSKKLD